MTIKNLLIILLLNPLYLFSYNVSCKGQIQETYVSAFATHGGAFWGEQDGAYVDGEIDFVNNEAYFIDSTSAVCGGDKNEVIFVYAICNDSINPDCWNVYHGENDNKLITFDNDVGKFVNNTIVVDYNPCIDTSSGLTFTFGIYTQDNVNFDNPFGYASLTTFTPYRTTALSQSDADQYRALCKEEEPTTGKDYTPYLETIIDNTSENKAIKDINDREETLNTNLETLINTREDNQSQEDTAINDFQSSYETTLSDTFTSYTDVFGFGDYGEAPSDITFTMFDKEYKVFTVETINPYLDFIRNTFLIFAYLWGIIIVFRSV